MELAEAKKKYTRQRNNAKQRGIDFKLTFDEWMAFWGADLDRRGVRALDLSMQRPMDQGPYEIGNIRKGTPRDNHRTRGAMYQTKKWRSIVAEYVSSIEASPDDGTEDDRPEPSELGYTSQWSWLDKGKRPNKGAP